MKCTLCHKSTSSALSTHKLCSSCIAHIQPATGTKTDCFSAEEKIKEETELFIDDDALVTATEEAQIVCGICLEEFGIDDFQQHERSCSYQLIFECLICREVYVSREGLWNHLDHHKIVEEQKEPSIKETTASQKHRCCVICHDHRGYTEKFYWEHIHEAHDGNFLHCSACRKHFRSKKLKSAHFMNQCNSDGASDSKEETTEEGTYSFFLKEKCPHCPERFRSVTRLYRHMYQVHKTKRTTEVNSLQKKVYLERNVPYRCKICNGKYCSKGSLRSHLKRVHGKSLNNDNIEKLANRCTGTDAQIAEKIHSGEPTEKSETVRKESETIVLDIEKSSGQSNEGQCPYCRTIFKDEYKLATHIDKSHVPADCDVCGKTFDNYSQMLYHKKRQHTEPKYVCPHCPIKFFNMCELRPHLTMHTQTEKIQCDLCGQWIKTQARMVIHMQKKHPEKAEEKLKNLPTTFPCPECPRIFKEEHRLEAHLYMCHKPASCDTCGTTFIGLHRKTYHNEKYHPEERHSCPHCTMKFHKKTDFHRHVRSHKSLKPEQKGTPIVCELCSCEFKDKSALRAHMNRIHPGIDSVGGDEVVQEESFGMVSDINHDYIPVKNEVLQEEEL